MINHFKAEFYKLRHSSNGLQGATSGIKKQVV